MDVRLAKPQDVSLLDDLLKETANRLKSKGSTQWSHILKGEETEALRKHIEQEEVIIFENDNQLVGMCYLYEEPNEWDQSLWGLEAEKGSYYLHKVVVSDLFIGKNMGSKVLENLFKWIEKHQGKVVRLDCKADVFYLNKLYQQVGFKFIKTCKAGAFEALFADFNLYEYHLHNDK
ncbi:MULTISPECIES: GNAT family N-acetyltransferase [Vagococcus]|uniref:GNAT family N-acetyltransferase n=1 Tax=Vagococcus TaxID=2737 RepID=UPI002FC7D22F